MSKKKTKTNPEQPKLRLEWVAAGQLAENPRNWRRHPDGQVKALQKVLADPDVGWAGACLYNERTQRLIDGHARRNAVGPDTVVPVLVGSWSEEAEKKILLTLDPLAGMAEADAESLAGLLSEVDLDCPELELLSDDLNETLEKQQAEDNRGREVVEDSPPEVDEVETRCKPGDLWKLGAHRLLCGDSTKAEDVKRCMGGEKADLCFTSPPYGAANTAKLRDHYVHGKTERKSYYESHEDKPDEWLELMRSWFTVIRPLVDAVMCNVQMLADNKRDMVAWLYEHADDLVDVIVWDKLHGAPQMQENVLTNAFEFLFVFGGNGSRAIPFGDFHGNVSNIVRIDPKGKNEFSDVHRATMPVAFPAWVMQTLCPKAETVVEPFCGSGTTIIAAEQLNRRCFGIEISPKYCDVILTRWEKFTGKTAERL